MNSSFILMVLVATQVIAESFPISSSGHMYMIDRLAQVFGFNYISHVPEIFEHFLHGPTIIVLVIYFWHAWYALIRLLIMSWSRLIKLKRWSYSQQCLQRLFYKVVSIVTIADGITVLFYFLIKKRLHNVELGDGMVLLGFILTMLLLLSLRWVHGRMVRDGTSCLLTTSGYLKLAVPLGIAQSIALLLPGFSRFASTYVVARWLGVPHRRAFQLSFLILFPLIIAGFFVNGVGGMIAQGLLFEMMTVPMLATLAGSTIISYYAFKLADWMGAGEKLWWFGVYMLVPITVMVWLLFS